MNETRSSTRVESAVAPAIEAYTALGVDVQRALSRLAKIPISLHCWQGDDVGGFENQSSGLGGGLVATGSYHGKARTPYDLRDDAHKAFSLIHVRHHFALHTMNCESVVI